MSHIKQEIQRGFIYFFGKRGAPKGFETHMVNIVKALIVKDQERCIGIIRDAGLVSNTVIDKIKSEPTGD